MTQAAYEAAASPEKLTLFSGGAADTEDAAVNWLLEEHAGEVDLIYLDPPFATGGKFRYTPRGAGGGKDPAAQRILLTNFES